MLGESVKSADTGIEAAMRGGPKPAAFTREMSFGKYAEEDQDHEGVMDSINEAAMALTRPSLTDRLSEKSWTPHETRRLRVRQNTLSDDDVDGDGYAAGSEATALDHTVTDMALGTLPGTKLRTHDEVDVAAEGISLEVRRFQCTKSTLALKEATKNDATLQSPKLVDYLVSLTYSEGGLCTEKEMCRWLVAQMCDRIATGQIWVFSKTYSLLYVLLWRGSRHFVKTVRDHGVSMFRVSHVVELLKRTPQENLSGARLPCSLQPIVSAAAGQKSSCGKAQPHTSCVIEMIKHKTCGKCHKNAGASESSETQVGYHEIPEGKLSFLYSNIAYLESLCEYRVRHPTLDLVHGEILAADAAEVTSPADPAAAGATKRVYSPTAWKELLDDTLELMKAIASADPHPHFCPIGASSATTRVRDALLLYQIACRALVRLLHAVLTGMHTFVASLQAGLQVNSSNLTPGGSAPTSSHDVRRNFLGIAFDPNYLDYSLTPDVIHDYVHTYYYAIYQFNRTVNMLRTYASSTDYVEAETAARALVAFKTLPEASIIELRDSRKMFELPSCTITIKRLYRAARNAAVHDDNDALEHSLSDSTLSNESYLHSTNSPLSDGEVRQSMLDIFKCHTDNHEYKERLWKHQVDAACNLFEPKESTMLERIFTAGLEGLRQQWQEFTNNGAAAAERALMDSPDPKSTPLRLQNISSTLGPSSSSDGLISSDHRSKQQASGSSDTFLKSSTYILRSLPSDVRVRAANGTKTDMISLSRHAVDSSTESSIDALLREDDVVVICNEECSCNDTLKLIDRFQVLMDVPLGQGSYGKVYRAWDEVVGCYLAAKELPLDASKAHNVAVHEVLQEYTVLTELSHPNIVRVVAFMVLKQTARIYMEWMPSGSLQDVLHNHPRGRLRESVVRRYAHDVLSGLAFLHSRGVIHRDVKPGNMLLSSDGAVKLTDFGTSLVLSSNRNTLESDVIAGTAAYMAPECVQGTYSSASDIWSFGCSIVQLISGDVPWMGPTTSSSAPEPIALLFKIGSLDDATHLERPHDTLKTAVAALQADEASAKGAAPVRGSAVDEATSDSGAGASSGVARETVSAALLSMLDAIFVVDRKQRPSASDLLHHPFFNAM